MENAFKMGKFAYKILILKLLFAFSWVLMLLLGPIYMNTDFPKMDKYWPIIAVGYFFSW